MAAGQWIIRGKQVTVFDSVCDWKRGGSSDLVLIEILDISLLRVIYRPYSLLENLKWGLHHFATVALAAQDCINTDFFLTHFSEAQDWPRFEVTLLCGWQHPLFGSDKKTIAFNVHRISPVDLFRSVRHKVFARKKRYVAATAHELMFGCLDWLITVDVRQIVTLSRELLFWWMCIGPLSHICYIHWSPSYRVRATYLLF